MKKLKIEIEVRFVPLPAEKRDEWKAAIRVLLDIIYEILDEENIPICPECQCEMHLTVEGKHVCRNETCPNYS